MTTPKLEEVAWTYRAEKAEAELKAIQSELIDADIVRGKDFRTLQAERDSLESHVKHLVATLDTKATEIDGLTAQTYQLEVKVAKAVQLLTTCFPFVRGGRFLGIASQKEKLESEVKQFIKDNT